MQEIDVIRQTKIFLRSQGLLGKKITDIYTDAHPSLLNDTKLEPFQRFTLQFDSFSVHPDLVGRLDDGETIFAVEAKGEDDWLKGIAQADSYRQGFHASIIAVSGFPSEDIRSFARQRGIGIIGVHPQGVDLIEQPPLHLPKLQFAKSILKQFSISNTLIRQFVYNMPTHYLSCASCLRVWENTFSSAATISEFEPFVRILYPEMPEQFRPALAGAEKLGLISIKGSRVELTQIGRACVDLLPNPIALNKLHQQSKRQTLAKISPQTGVVLRILLDSDPIAKFITDVLSRIGRNEPVTMTTLAENASRLDNTLTSTVFFFPKIIVDIIDDQGFIVWRKVQPHHYRTTVYMQYKKILIQAGIIEDHGIGGTSSKSYNPEKDIWELIV